MSNVYQDVEDAIVTVLKADTWVGDTDNVKTIANLAMLTMAIAEGALDEVSLSVSAFQKAILAPFTVTRNAAFPPDRAGKPARRGRAPPAGQPTC